MLIVGLTGGIGSGKTTVANLFAKHQIPIIDADHIARDITTPQGAAFDNIVSHFGKQILQPDGTLNRSTLRKQVFEHPNERLWLENLLHPIIRDQIQQQIQRFKAPYCLVVIPLLIETGDYPYLHRILVIDTPESLQTERVAARDNSSKDQINAIINTQATRAERLARANDVITNADTLENLSAQVNQLHEQYLVLSNKLDNI